MIRTIRRAAALAAVPAALAIAFAGTASAAPASAQSATDKAFSQIVWQGDSESLDDTKTTCTQLSASRHSARLDSGRASYNFYSDSSCTTLVGTATPLVPAQVFLDSNHDLVAAVAYKAF
ncbi:hypothetical protein [Streptomyces tubercidicus]|uniref:hypothetical protein n=1 Tax=Streptomyces tubercidicus TaxID=47759 RepID=UPI0034678B45